MEQKAEEKLPFNKVIVHPLVLLSVVDHYSRVSKDAPGKRVVGILLGHVSHGAVDVLNCYAVPFEEDGSVWFLDHNYHENMARMFRKVTARENVVGWYSTGPKIRPCDIEINELVRRYTPNPVLVVIDVDARDELALPIESYVAVEEVAEEEPAAGEVRPVSAMKFRHLNYEVQAVEAEDIGVEHLLRDIQGRGGRGTVTERVQDKARALRSLQSKLAEVRTYLVAVATGKLPRNQRVLERIQDMFNLMPDVEGSREYTRAFAVKSNDMLAAVYVGALARAVIALHDLILNKTEYREAEHKLDTADKDKSKDKDKPATTAQPLSTTTTASAAPGSGNAEKK